MSTGRPQRARLSPVVSRQFARVLGLTKRLSRQRGLLPKSPKPGCFGHMHKLATPLPDDPLRVQGWALFLRGTVSRVDVSVDGRVVGQARIGLPRRDLRARAMLGWNPAASVCGFEWMPDPADLPSDRGSSVSPLGSRAPTAIHSCSAPPGSSSSRRPSRPTTTRMGTPSACVEGRGVLPHRPAPAGNPGFG